MDRSNKVNESLLRDSTKKQMMNLKKEIDKAGGDIEAKVRKTSQKKEYQMPNAMYMDNPFGSKRQIETWENFSKNDAHNKSVAAKSTQPKNIKKMCKFEDFNYDKNITSLNENSRTDFIVHYRDELKQAMTNLRKLSDVYEQATEEDFEKIEKKLRSYDKNVDPKIEYWISFVDDTTIDDIANFAIQNQNDFGTEPQMVLFAIEEYVNVLDKYMGSDDEIDESVKPVNESIYPMGKVEELFIELHENPENYDLRKDDFDKLYKFLTKCGLTEDGDVLYCFRELENKDKKEALKLVGATEEMIQSAFNEDNGVTESNQEENENDLNESKDDEEKYLTPKQRKLPEGLKKGIIKKMKKSGKKVDDKDCKKCDDKDVNEKIELSDEELKDAEEIKSTSHFNRRFKLKDDRLVDVKPTGEITDVDDDTVDLTDVLTDEEVKDAKEIETTNTFKTRYQLKDGRIVDVQPNGRISLVSESKKEKFNTKIDDWVQTLDPKVKGTTDDKIKPMFVNLPNRKDRPSYDVLRAGKYIELKNGITGQIVGLKNDMIVLDVINKDTNEHEIIELEEEFILKNLKKDKTKKGKKE